MERVVILGHTNAAQIFYAILKDDPNIEVAAFSVHERYRDKNDIFGIPLVSFEKLVDQFHPDEYKILNAVGYGNVNQNREQTYIAAKTAGYGLISYIHPSAINLAERIGEGVFVMPGAVIEPYSEIGTNTVICSNTVIAHHSFVGDNCWIASGTVISGGAIVKRNSFVGVNATVVNNIIVEEYNIIGAQTMVAKNTSKNGVYLSRPGEPHRFTSEDYAKHFLA